VTANFHPIRGITVVVGRIHDSCSQPKDALLDLLENGAIGPGRHVLSVPHTVANTEEGK